MVDIQCSSCNTRYRIDERVLPQDTPTFKCSRCGHVFSLEPRAMQPAAPEVTPKPDQPKLRPAPKAQAPRAPREPEAGASAAESRPEPTSAFASEQPRRPDKGPVIASEATSQPERRRMIDPEPTSEPDPLARPFADRGEEPEPGEEHAFDFDVEDHEHAASPDDATTESDEWEVGESDSHLHFRSEPGDRSARGSRRADPSAAAKAPRRRQKPRLPETEAEMPSLGSPIHSAGFFLACFFFAALCFGALSLMIASEPAASAAFLARLPGLGDQFANPALPAVKIALRDVRAEYHKIGDRRTALVITGEALNVGSRALHEIQLEASLLDGGKQTLAKQAVFCGNNLSGRMISEMTPREVDFFQKLGPPKAFLLQPSGTYPFTIVFIEPSNGASAFAIEVARAEPAAEAPADTASAPPGG
jgi:predicted Zn finger-like uncharacterized protein